MKQYKGIFWELIFWITIMYNAVFVYGSEYEAQFDGYLFELSESPLEYDSFFDSEVTAATNIVKSESEYICDNIYWIQDIEDISALDKAGIISYYEPNYRVTLFDNGVSSYRDNGCSYEMLHAEYADERNINGSGIRIGVIDSGVDFSNLDLQNADILDGHDYITQSQQVTDEDYHGTMVIQVISGDKNLTGTTGIARKASIVPLKCFSGSSGGTIRYLVEAIYDAVDKYNCDIINMSWGLSEQSALLYKAINYAYNAGVFMVAASGNVTSSFPQGTLIYPACYDEVIGVSAIDASYTIIDKSQRGNNIMVCAPGERIPLITSLGTVSYESGTSFAAPCVTSVLALLLQLSPYFNYEAIIELFAERVVDLGNDGFDELYGYGFPQIDVLIGLKWSYYLISEENASRKYKVYGWYVNNSPGSIIIASYDSSGQMQEIKLLEMSNQKVSFEEFIDKQGISEFVVYYTDEELSPISNSDHYTFNK